MKKQLMTMAILGGLIVSTGLSQAQAQIVDRIKADIPFNFYVGEKLLPAGEYTITPQTKGLMLIQRDDGKASAYFMTNDMQDRQAPTVSEIVFNRYGNETFLARVEEQGTKDGVEAVKSKLEKKAARNMEEESSILLLMHN